MGQAVLLMSLFALVAVASDSSFTSSERGIEIHAPLTHYVFTGDLRLTYRVVSPSLPKYYQADLFEPETNRPLQRKNITLPALNIWSMIEFSCSLLIPPGSYVVKLYPSSQSDRDHHPDIVSQSIEIRWLESVEWSLPPAKVRIFTDPLTVNVSLHSQTACPQQEPGNFTLVINLHYIQDRSAGHLEAEVVNSRALQWPFGTTRTPSTTAIVFPCQLFDRTGGGYYATLGLRSPGRDEVVILDRSRLVEAVHNESDYNLLINGDVRRCRPVGGGRVSSGEKGVRVTYQAPACVGRDRIRLYRLDSQHITMPKMLSELNQTYLMERSIQSRPRYASFNFPCRVFTAHPDALGFCWIYTSSSRDGQYKELTGTRQCFPYSDVGEKVWKLAERPIWSNWTAWTPCTGTCRSEAGQAVQMRSRFCVYENTGIFQHACRGAALETKSCRVPLCHHANDPARRDNAENIFAWFPVISANRAHEVDNRTSMFVYRIYESEEGFSVTDFLQTNHHFFLVVLPALGSFLLLLTCCILPDITRFLLKKPILRDTTSSSTNPNRDSRYALISKEDEPATCMPTTQKLAPPACDQPSRSGVMEMQIFSPPPANAVPSPLILQRACQDKRQKSNCSQSPRSSSHLSNRPEPGDVIDFEYDDFIPEKFADEEDNVWTPQRLDIKVFATAYEDIVKELNISRKEEEEEAGTTTGTPADENIL